MFGQDLFASSVVLLLLDTVIVKWFDIIDSIFVFTLSLSNVKMYFKNASIGRRFYDKAISILCYLAIISQYLANSFHTRTHTDF